MIYYELLESYQNSLGRCFLNKSIKFLQPERGNKTFQCYPIHFHITEIEKADHWTHDFGDGSGEISGAYGPFFIRLEVPGHKGIGIHGTHKPKSIGTRDTDGCIRLYNQDLVELVQFCHIGMAVLIIPSYADVMKSGKIDSLQLVIRKHEDSITTTTSTSQKVNKSEAEKTSRTEQIKLKGIGH